MAEWRRGTFRIAKSGVEQGQEVFGLVTGLFGVHRAMGGTWACTHIPTGYRCGERLQLMDALEYCERIAELGDWTQVAAPGPEGKWNGPSNLYEAAKEFANTFKPGAPWRNE